MAVKRRRKNSSQLNCDQLRQPRIGMPLPQTEMPGRLQAHFAERGIRMTQQRRAILSVMETASKHLDASQILRKAQKIDASVDRSTVYRTLRLLKRQGLIDELDLMHINGEGHYYERKLQRDHIHMACLRCGKITEFVSDSFERLKQQVEIDCRFRVLITRLEIGGYCAACRGAQRRTPYGDRIKRKSALDLSVQDASAALPQNCQTTRWILRTFSFRVNVTLVIRRAEFRIGRVARRLLFLPGLAAVAGNPVLGGRGRNPSMLCIYEFQADDIAGKSRAC